jgi:hypothetical protein
LIVSGAATAMAGLIRRPDVLILSPIAVYLLADRSRSVFSRVQWVAIWGLPVILTVLFDLWYDRLRFGSSLNTGYTTEGTGLFSGNLATSLPALLASPGLGLLVYAPALLVGVAGIWWFVIRERRVAALLAAVALVNLLFYGLWSGWIGGLAWGPRFLLPITPLLLIPAAEVFSRWRQLGLVAKAAIRAAALLSSLFQLAGVLIDYVYQAYALGEDNGNNLYWRLDHSLLFTHLGVIFRLLPDLSLGGALSLDGHSGLDFWWSRAIEDGVSPGVVWPFVALVALLGVGAAVSLTRAARRTGIEREAGLVY